MVDKVAFSPSPVGGVSSQPAGTTSQPATTGGASFQDVLKAQLGREPAVRFSAHAQRRIEARQIDLSGDETVRLEQAIDKAARKGARESLILMDDLAFVVNVKSRLVVTALDTQSRKEDVFTNIDSVVLT
jgi:flagellar operon protein